MSIVRFALAGTAAALLTCGAAAAQNTAPPVTTPVAVPATAPNLSPKPADVTAPVIAPSAAAVGVNASVTTDANGNRYVVVSSPPVPDTAENRAKYGHPLSNAGRLTPAKGN